MENRPVLETLARLIKTTLKDNIGENRQRPKRMLRDYFSLLEKRLSKMEDDEYSDKLILDEIDLLQTSLKEAFVILKKRENLSSNQEIIDTIWEDYNNKTPKTNGQSFFFKYFDIFKKKLPEEKSYYIRIFSDLAETQKFLKQVRFEIERAVDQKREEVPVE
jgi:hypothetical protein